MSRESFLNRVKEALSSGSDDETDPSTGGRLESSQM